MEVGAKFERIARRRAGGFCAAGKSRNTQIKKGLNQVPFKVIHSLINFQEYYEHIALKYRNLNILNIVQ